MLRNKPYLKKERLILFIVIFAPGDSSRPIVYDVEILRDGGSFSARRVCYSKWQAYLLMTASFQSQEEGYSHQNLMPDVPPPTKLISR